MEITDVSEPLSPLRLIHSRDGASALHLRDPPLRRQASLPRSQNPFDDLFPDSPDADPISETPLLSAPLRQPRVVQTVISSLSTPSAQPSHLTELRNVTQMTSIV